MPRLAATFVAAAALVRASAPRAQDAAPAVEVADVYLQEYGELYDHVSMLWDEQRMGAYHRAIRSNEASFRGKAVLDVGTGTGVLALWAAQAGARKVYAVEAGSLDVVGQLAEAHGLGDVIVSVRGRIEDVTLPEQVDVILSEWMGYFLLRESMVESVLFARDRWLKPGGLMFPSEATVYVAPMRAEHFMARRRGELEQDVRYWSKLEAELAQYDLDFSPLRDRYEREHARYHFAAGWQGNVPAASLTGEPVEVLHVDMHTVTPAQLYSTHAKLTIREAADAEIHALCGWFDVRFCTDADGASDAGACVELTTSPRSAKTHWAHTVFPLAAPLVSPDLTLSISHAASSRHDINVSLAYVGGVDTARVEVDDDGAATRVGDRREVRRDFLVSAAFQGFNDQPYDEANDGESVLLIYADGERVGGTKDDD